MIPVLTGAQMRAVDRRAIEEHGVPGSVLMESAGRAVAEAIRARFPSAARPLILCGKGNNGGDGFVVARLLLGLVPRVLLVGPRGSVKGDASSSSAPWKRPAVRSSRWPMRRPGRGSSPVSART